MEDKKQEPDCTTETLLCSENVCLKSNYGFVAILPKIRNENVFNLI